MIVAPVTDTDCDSLIAQLQASDPAMREGAAEQLAALGYGSIGCTSWGMTKRGGASKRICGC